MWRRAVWLEGISTLKKDAAGLCKCFLFIYQTTRCWIREDWLFIIIIIIVFCGLTEVSEFKTVLVQHRAEFIIIIIIIIIFIFKFLLAHWLSGGGVPVTQEL